MRSSDVSSAPRYLRDLFTTIPKTLVVDYGGASRYLAGDRTALLVAAQ